MNDLSRRSICFIAGTLGQGGAERQLYYLLQVLRRAKARPSVLCLGQGEFWEAKIQELGIRVTCVGLKKSRIIRLVHIIRELGTRRPDLVQSQHFYANIYASLAARCLNLREIGAIRSDVINEVKSVRGRTGKLCLTLPRMLAANSRNGMRNAVRLGVPPVRLFHLPNVVDTNVFLPERTSHHGTFRVAAIGRMTREKRFDRFLRCIAAARREDAPRLIQGLIAGDGPERPALEKLAMDLGLAPGGVTFLGKVGEVQAIYRSADAFMSTSDWEGTPNVIMEAMACALPVVATRVGGVEELITDGKTGLLKDSHDERGLCEAVVRLAHHQQLRETLGDQARADMVARHSLDALEESLTRLYQSNEKRRDAMRTGRPQAEAGGALARQDY